MGLGLTCDWDSKWGVNSPQEHHTDIVHWGRFFSEFTFSTIHIDSGDDFFQKSHLLSEVIFCRVFTTYSL